MSVLDLVDVHTPLARFMSRQGMVQANLVARTFLNRFAVFSSRENPWLVSYLVAVPPTERLFDLLATDIFLSP